MIEVVTPETVLRCEKVTVGYNAKAILTDVDLDVKRGEIVALLGGSGCGKSTMLRAITGLLAPLSGDVTLLGEHMYTLNADERRVLLRRTGMAFQQDALFGSMSVMDNVALPLHELTKLPKPIIREMARLRLELVGLAGFEKRMPAEMSGGQRKRAALARASIMDPEIIFCDEPSAGLDPVVAAELDATLLKFREILGITLVIVSHELDSVRALADRAIMFGKGRALAIGTIPELEHSANQDVYHYFHAKVCMSDRRKAVKVGIFTFVTGALVALVLVIFGGLKFWKHHDRYFIDFNDSVMGLSEGTKVYFNGIKVGTVGSIKLDAEDPSAVRVAIDVDRGTPIRTDTAAMLNMGGITGLKTIDLQGGSIKAAPLPPGSKIAVAHGVLDKLEKQAEQLADNSGKMIKRATDILEGANEIIVNLKAITDPKGIGAIVESTKQTAENLHHASQEVSAMVSEERIALKSAVDSLKGTMDSLKGTSDSMHVAVDSAAKTVDNANSVVFDVKALIHNNQGTISSMLVDLRQAARGFKELAREVREKPSRLLLSDSPPERKLP